MWVVIFNDLFMFQTWMPEQFHITISRHSSIYKQVGDSLFSFFIFGSIRCYHPTIMACATIWKSLSDIQNYCLNMEKPQTHKILLTGFLAHDNTFFSFVCTLAQENQWNIIWIYSIYWWMTVDYWQLNMEKEKNKPIALVWFFFPPQTAFNLHQ